MKMAKTKTKSHCPWGSQSLLPYLALSILIFSLQIQVSFGVGGRSSGRSGEGRASADHNYCYEIDSCKQGSATVNEWSQGMCKDGKKQSPINLDTTLALPSDPKLVECSTLDLSKAIPLYHFEDYTMINTGDSVYMKKSENHPEFEWAERGIKYKFEQFHFHWGPRNDLGSEHAFSGHSYPMEMHLVHYSTKYKDLGEAVAAKDDPVSLAVLGFLLEIGKKSDAFIKPFVDQLKSGALTKIDSHIEVKKSETDKMLSLKEVFEGQTEAFSYEGSLTAPAGKASCAEKVAWFVFRKPIAIQTTDVEEFRKVEHKFGSEAPHKATITYRTLQALNGRKVKVIKVKT